MANREALQKPPGYQHWPDLVRVSAIFFVVMVHLAADAVGNNPQLPHRDWQVANLINSSVRLCVPLFFMLTGYLLLSKKEPLGEYFNKRFSRILLPWLAWSIIYLWWSVHHFNAHMTLLHAFNLIASDNVKYHLWFLYAIMGMYLYIPVLRIFIRHSDDANVKYYLAICFIVTSVLPCLTGLINFFYHQDISWAIVNRANMFYGFSGYVILGFRLGNLKISPKLYLAAWAGYGLSVLITAILNAHWQVAARAESYFYSYFSPNVALMSVCGFVILKYLGENVSWGAVSSKVLRNLGEATFGIYLVHLMVLDVMSDNKMASILAIAPGNAYYMVMIRALVVYSISYAVTRCILSVPILKRIV